MKTLIIIGVVVGFLGIISLTTCIVVDFILMKKKLKEISAGMTGKEIQEKAKCQVKIEKVDGDEFEAKVVSPLKFFKYKLIFKNGKLKQVGRI